jgi:hypothetical protein
MTSTIAPTRKSITTTPTNAPDNGMTMTDGSVGDISEMSIGSVDSFSPAPSTSAPRHEAFDPPRSPVLIDEAKAPNVAAARTENRARIDAYNREYRGYLGRVEDAARTPEVNGAQLARATKGMLSSYQPLANLPPDQRKQYELMTGDVMAARLQLHDALGERVLADKHIQDPGRVKGTFDVRLTGLGNGVRATGDTRDGAQVMHGEGLNNALVHDASEGAKLAAEEEAKKLAKLGLREAAKTTIDAGVTHWSNGETSITAKIGEEGGGYIGVESEGKTLQTEGGVRVGIAHEAEATLAAYSSTDGDNVGAGMKGGFAAHHVELEGQVGAAISLLSTECVKEARTGDGFYDDDRLQAHRIGGR